MYVPPKFVIEKTKMWHRKRTPNLRKEGDLTFILLTKYWSSSLSSFTPRADDEEERTAFSQRRFYPQISLSLTSAVEIRLSIMVARWL